MILSPALRRWGPPRRQGLCSHLAHLCATFDSVPRSKALWTLKRRGLCNHLVHLWATSDAVPHPEALLRGIADAPADTGYVARRPLVGPL